MENPASWTEVTHAIQKAIDEHKAEQDAGAIGGSLAAHIEDTVFAPRIASLAHQIKVLSGKVTASDLLKATPEHIYVTSVVADIFDAILQNRLKESGKC